MKVCIFTETYFPVVGGGETQARLLAEGLIANGHSVLLLTRRSDTALEKHEFFGPIPVYRLSPAGMGQLKKWGLLVTSIPALIRLRHNFDLIFVSGYRVIGLTAILIGKMLGKRVVLKADSQGEMSGEFFASGLQKFGISPRSLLFRFFVAFRNTFIKRADGFSAISPEIAEEWISAGIPSGKIAQIPNSVDTTRFVPADAFQRQSLRTKLDLPLSASIAIYTGRLVSYKGLPLLLDVWNDLCRKHENTMLLLAGTGGLDIHNCEAELRRFVKVHGLEQHVRFLGPIQNVPDFLQAADLFVFPTENDAFPSSLVEAMACALPVVTTPVGAIKTIVSHNKNGLFVEPGNKQQLFDTLDVMLSDPASTYRLGQAACELVQSYYSASETTRKYLSLFHQVIETA